jgi:hypothetical protein
LVLTAQNGSGRSKCNFYCSFSYSFWFVFI